LFLLLLSFALRLVDVMDAVPPLEGTRDDEGASEKRDDFQNVFRSF
jgi:hypothetical protein